MSKINTTYEPKMVSLWSRCHSPNCNFLLIEETIYIQTNHKSGISYSKSYGQKDLELYELDKNQTDPAAFIEDCMSDNNVAVKDYKYYRVLFANGADIICKDYAEFVEILNN